MNSLNTHERTAWIPAKVQPRHDGFYEVQITTPTRQTPTLRRVAFSNGQWQRKGTGTLISWRGQFIRLDAAKKYELLRFILNYKNSLPPLSPAYRESVIDVALQLARHYTMHTSAAPTGYKKEACVYFVLAERLGATLEPAALAYKEATWAKLSAIYKDEILRRVEQCSVI